MVKKVPPECGANTVGKQKCFLSNKIKMKSRTVSHLWCVIMGLSIFYYIFKKIQPFLPLMLYAVTHRRSPITSKDSVSAPVSCGTGFPLDKSDQYITPARHGIMADEVMQRPNHDASWVKCVLFFTRRTVVKCRTAG